MSTISDPKAPQEVIHVRAQLAWVNGEPRIVGRPDVFDKRQAEQRLRDLMKVSLNLPYSGPEPELQGLTNGEAMIVQMARQAAAGNRDARQDILDRIMGRPQQNIKSLRVNADLNDFLDQLEDPPEPLDIDPNVSRETSDPAEEL